MSFADLTRERYSCRHFTEESVEPAQLAAILEAGRIAPSACNKHPTRVMVCDTPEKREAAAAAPGQTAGVLIGGVSQASRLRLHPAGGFQFYQRTVVQRQGHGRRGKMERRGNIPNRNAHETQPPY